MKRSPVLWLPVILLVVSIANAPGQTTTVDVVYTGKLLGYFRVPSLQKVQTFRGCYPRSDQDSDAASEFLTKLETERQYRSNTILVGTGDNFAPQLEARMFAEPTQGSGRYPVANKEFYFGKGQE